MQVVTYISVCFIISIIELCVALYLSLSLPLSLEFSLELLMYYELLSLSILLLLTVEAVGFTARSPDTSKSNNSLIIFSRIETNVGDGYNEKTGKFRCKIPGLYFFIAVILRNLGSTSYSYCHIRVNDKNTVFAYAHSKDSNEHPSGAAHLSVQLKEEDEVYLGNCHGVDRIDGGSHFSGFMISHT